MEQIAAYVSLFGVVLIARPMSLFAFLSQSKEATHADPDVATPINSTAGSHRLAAEFDAVTPAQRASAVGVAMMGVLGAAGAYTTIRWIGKRAHPLISVNYFATWCTIVSILMMVVLPEVGILFPKSLKDWGYLTFLGICGFVMVGRHGLVDIVTVLTDDSNFSSLLAYSMRSLLERPTWSTYKCSLRSVLTNLSGAPLQGLCRLSVHR